MGFNSGFKGLIKSRCNVRGMWQINKLVVLLYNLEGKRPTVRARRRGEVFIEIDLKGNGWGKWAIITFLVIVTR